MEEPIVLGQLDRHEALRYLGYGQVEADARMQQLLAQCEQKVLQTARPRYVYRVFDITAAPEGIRVEGTSLCLTGKSIAVHLAGCSRAVLMAVTISDGIDRLLRIAQLEDMAEALVLDSLAGVAVEQVCDQVEQLLKQKFPDWFQTFRFGLGYGDLPVTLQSDFLKVLDAPKQIGLHVSPSSMLVPTKSVTAVIGLSGTEIKGGARGCQTCSLRSVCKFREKGGHCNG